MVNLSKAFDMVSHTILLRKLASYGVILRAGELIWFDSYLNGRETEGVYQWNSVRYLERSSTMINFRTLVVYNM